MITVPLIAYHNLGIGFIVSRFQILGTINFIAVRKKKSCYFRLAVFQKAVITQDNLNFFSCKSFGNLIFFG